MKFMETIAAYSEIHVKHLIQSMGKKKRSFLNADTANTQMFQTGLDLFLSCFTLQRVHSTTITMHITLRTPLVISPTFRSRPIYLKQLTYIYQSRSHSSSNYNRRHAPSPKSPTQKKNRRTSMTGNIIFLSYAKQGCE